MKKLSNRWKKCVEKYDYIYTEKCPIYYLNFYNKYFQLSLFEDVLTYLCNIMIMNNKKKMK